MIIKLLNGKIAPWGIFRDDSDSGEFSSYKRPIIWLPEVSSSASLDINTLETSELRIIAEYANMGLIQISGEDVPEDFLGSYPTNTVVTARVAQGYSFDAIDETRQPIIDSSRREIEQRVRKLLSNSSSSQVRSSLEVENNNEAPDSFFILAKEIEEAGLARPTVLNLIKYIISERASRLKGGNLLDEAKRIGTLYQSMVEDEIDEVKPVEKKKKITRRKTK